jgi:type I restriction enzyme M protein
LPAQTFPPLSQDEENAVDSQAEPAPSGDGMLLDYVTGRLVKETPKEGVRQRIARALLHEYGISADDMAPDFKVRASGKTRKLDLAIFHAGQPHTAENLSRVVFCQPEPKLSKNGVARIRDYEQAEKDLEAIKEVMEVIPSCRFGLWTNGLEFFFLEKQETRFETRFEPLGDWPLEGDSQGTRDVASMAYIRKADAFMLRTAFRRCHNFIHGNEGMPKDAAFWQFLYLVFCKMHDERAPRASRQFWAGPKEQFEEEGRRQIRQRIMPLFAEVKATYPNIFSGGDEIRLSDRALAFMVSELAKYDFTRTEVDAKGAAYQEIVGTNLRGDKGQYFTPRGVVKLAVEMLDPQEHERVLDPACGTGGFLVATLGHMLKKFRDESGVKANDETSEEFLSVTARLREYASRQVYGADFDQFLIKASQMNMVMAGDGAGHLYHLNSLEFPKGHLTDLERARRDIPLGSVDVLLTNPPFGSDIPITEPQILEQYDLAAVWERTEDGNFRRTHKRQSSVAPEVLFIERCLRWLKPGGRMGIVLPDGILGNPAAEYIRWWILREAQVLASVDLPVEVFIVEANVNILTSLLFLRRKTDEEKMAEALGGQREYPVFMAVAEKVGVDRRGNRLYKRRPDGEEIIEERTHTERVRKGDGWEVKTLRRKEKIVDDDLPVIADKYREFRREHGQ